MPSTDAKPYALIMQTDGGFVLADWTPTTTPADTMARELEHRATLTRPVVVHPAVTMWVDDDAELRGLPVNGPAGRILRLLRAPEFMYCGPVLYTGALTNLVDGPEGLTEDQALQLIEQYLTGKRVLTRSLHIPAQRTH